MQPKQDTPNPSQNTSGEHTQESMAHPDVNPQSIYPSMPSHGPLANDAAGLKPEDSGQMPQERLRPYSILLFSVWVFVLTLILSYAFEQSLFKQSGYFSELANVFTLPLRLGFSLALAFGFWTHIKARKRFFLLVWLATFLVFMPAVQNLVQSDAGTYLGTYLRLEPRLEAALITAAVVWWAYLAVGLTSKFGAYVRGRARLTLSFIAVSAVVAILGPGVAVAATRHTGQRVEEDRRVALPQLEGIQVQHLGNPEKTGNFSFNIIFLQEPLNDDGMRPARQVKVKHVGYGQTVEEHCGATYEYSQTPEGTAYGVYTYTAPGGEFSRLCFSFGQYNYEVTIQDLERYGVALIDSFE